MTGRTYVDANTRVRQTFTSIVQSRTYNARRFDGTPNAYLTGIRLVVLRTYIVDSVTQPDVLERGSSNCEIVGTEFNGGLR